MSLSTKALLVYLSVSQWTGRKLDKRATRTVVDAHATKSNAGNYTKKLLPGAKELERVNALAGSMRKFFYEETLPWFSDGARIIASQNYLPFTKELAKRKAEFQDAVTEFISVYPSLQAEAQASLGNLYSPSDYPSPSRLASAFQCEISFMPLPAVQDFRTEVTASEKEAFLAKMKSVEAQAMADCWKRLYDVVQKAADKLASPEAIFRDSLLDNVTEICGLLPRLNVTDDPALEEARQKVETAIASMKPEALRDSSKDRQDSAAKLAEILRSMGAFMGGEK